MKRILAGVLWFLAVTYAWNLVALVLPIPDALGLLLGAVVGVTVGLDPMHRIWPHAPKPAVAHSNEPRTAAVAS